MAGNMLDHRNHPALEVPRRGRHAKGRHDFGVVAESAVADDPVRVRPGDIQDRGAVDGNPETGKLGGDQLPVQAHRFFRPA